MQRHARIDGDMMFIGKEPGTVDDVVMLQGAQVALSGNTVAISNAGRATVFQTLKSHMEAASWAEKVRSAAGLWDECERMTEAALSNSRMKRRLKREQERTRSPETGGTGPEAGGLISLGSSSEDDE